MRIDAYFGCAEREGTADEDVTTTKSLSLLIRNISSVIRPEELMLVSPSGLASVCVSLIRVSTIIDTEFVPGK